VRPRDGLGGLERVIGAVDVVVVFEVDDLVVAELDLKAVQPTLGRLAVLSAAVPEMLDEDDLGNAAWRRTAPEDRQGDQGGREDEALRHGSSHRWNRPGRDAADGGSAAVGTG
jgi:hypothetical protein